MAKDNTKIHEGKQNGDKVLKKDINDILLNQQISILFILENETPSILIYFQLYCMYCILSETVNT